MFKFPSKVIVDDSNSITGLTQTGDVSGAYFGSSIAADDTYFAVGAPGSGDASKPARGKVYLYDKRMFNPQQPKSVIEGELAYDGLGNSLAFGDFDHDNGGIPDDLAVSAAYATRTNKTQGVVNILWDFAALPASYTVQSSNPSQVCSGLGLSALDSLGYNLLAGDYTGDGITDLLACGPNTLVGSQRPGSCFLFPGGAGFCNGGILDPSSPSVIRFNGNSTLSGGGNPANFGISAAFGKFYNSTGLSLLIGAYGEDPVPGMIDAGGAYLYPPNARSYSTHFTGPVAYYNMGFTVNRIGNFFNTSPALDSFALSEDWASVLGRINDGVVSLIQPMSFPSSSSLATLPLVQIAGATSSNHLGVLISPVTDFNGNGFPSFMAGGGGSLGVYYGGAPFSPKILDSAYLTGINGTEFVLPASYTGILKGMEVGDVNGDGIPDLALIAPTATVNGTNYVGKMRYIYGDRSAILFNTTITVPEFGTATVTSNMLSALRAGLLDPRIKFKFAYTPQISYLWTTPGVPIFNVIQQQILNGALQITDRGTGLPQVFSIQVMSPIGLAPTLPAQNVTINLIPRLRFLNTTLNALQAQTRTLAGEFQVLGEANYNPSTTWLRLSNLKGLEFFLGKKTIANFSKLEQQQGLISYQAYNSPIPPSGAIEAIDARGVSSGVQSLQVSFKPVAQVAVNNFVVSPGANPIGPTNLRITDKAPDGTDIPPGEIEIMTTPMRCWEITNVLTDSPDGNFTQQDVNTFDLSLNPDLVSPECKMLPLPVFNFSVKDRFMTSGPFNAVTKWQETAIVEEASSSLLSTLTSVAKGVGYFSASVTLLGIIIKIYDKIEYYCITTRPGHANRGRQLFIKKVVAPLLDEVFNRGDEDEQLALNYCFVHRSNKGWTRVMEDVCLKLQARGVDFSVMMDEADAKGCCDRWCGRQRDEEDKQTDDDLEDKQTTTPTEGRINHIKSSTLLSVIPKHFVAVAQTTIEKGCCFAFWRRCFPEVSPGAITEHLRKTIASQVVAELKEMQQRELQRGSSKYSVLTGSRVESAASESASPPSSESPDGEGVELVKPQLNYNG